MVEDIPPKLRGKVHHIGKFYYAIPGYIKEPDSLIVGEAEETLEVDYAGVRYLRDVDRYAARYRAIRDCWCVRLLAWSKYSKLALSNSVFVFYKGPYRNVKPVPSLRGHGSYKDLAKTVQENIELLLDLASHQGSCVYFAL